MDELSVFISRLVDTALRYSLPLRLGAVAVILALLLGLKTTWSSKASLTQVPYHAIRAFPFTLIGIVLVAVLVIVMFPGVIPEAQAPVPTVPPMLCDGTGFIGNPQTMLYYPPGTDLPLLSPRERCFVTQTSAEVAGYKAARN